MNVSQKIKPQNLMQLGFVYFDRIIFLSRSYEDRK